jgi:hypothetical protein
MNDFLIKEIYQYLFIMSTIYLTCVVLLFCIRFIRNVVYDVNSSMKFGLSDKILMLTSLALIFAYLF